MYSLTVLEARSPKQVSEGPNQGVGRAALLLEAHGGRLSPGLFPLLEALTLLVLGPRPPSAKLAAAPLSPLLCSHSLHL